MRPFRELALYTRQSHNLPKNLERIKTKWRSIGFSATAQNPPGQVSDPDFDIDTGGWLFDRNSTEILYLIGQVTTDWREGSAVIPAVHWQKTTSASGNVLWRLQYKVSRVGEVMDANFTDIDVSTTADISPDTDTADLQLISLFENTKEENLQINDILVMRLGRIGGDAADTYGADARLLYFDIYVQVDDWGSNNPTSK